MASVRSMTGYGKGDVTLHNRRFIVEIKSVNHRYNEISIRLPRVLNQFEDTVRKIISTKISRGKTDVFITMESFSENDISIKLNRPLLLAYLTALNEIKELVPNTDEPSLSLLSRFPEVLIPDKQNETEQTTAEIIEALTESVTNALNQITKMREKEGAALKADIIRKLDYIQADTKQIEKRAPAVAEDYKTRLKEKVTTALSGANYDETRFLTEVTLFADKSCIDEEIIRLFSHIAQTREVLDNGGSIGRKLDFLSQEINREVNTIASKSNDIEITNISVGMKSELEKIREQVQNIE